MDLHDKSFATRAVHAGERVKPSGFTPVASPIMPSVGYLYGSMDDLDAVFANEKPGYVYARYTSPTLSAFETAVASLEGGEAALAFSSGMAAIHAALLAAGVKAGASVVSSFDVYGATYSLLARFFSQMNVNAIMVDVSDLASVEKALKEASPVALLVETISNPLLKVADVPTLAG
jgi:cystathionine gamma-synthase/methionine-gamma-lyase